MLYQTLNIKYISPEEISKNINIKHNFSFLNVNIRSLNKNFIKLQILLDQLKFSPTLICVTETWLTKNKPFLYSLENYDFINKVGDNQSGGTCVFIRSEINYEVMPSLELKVPDCQDIWLKLNLSKTNTIIFGSVYRHPDYDFSYFQDKLLNNIGILNDNNSHFLIGGDFNINLLNDNNKIENYKNEIQSQGTMQLVRSATRISPTSNNRTLLDHMYTNVFENKTNTFCIEYDISDHVPVITFLKSNQNNVNNQATQKVLIRDLSNFNPDEFVNDLENKIPHLDLNGSLDVNQLWDNFELLFNSTLLQHAPLRPQTRRERKRKTKPYITNKILASIKEKKKLFKTALNNPSSENWKEYKKYRNKLTRDIEISKQNYYKTQFQYNQHNSKNTWKILNRIVNLKSKQKNNQIKISTVPDNIITDNKQIANTFNHHFITIGEKINKTINNNINTNYTLNNIPENKDTMFLNPITSYEVYNSIKQLNPNKATRSDCSSVKFIQISASVISPVIAYIINKCIEQGVFPNQLKSAEVIPVFKKGDKLQITNYRPISLLSPFSKIFERHLHNEITKFINKYKILYPFQFGFRKNSSTEQAVTQITDNITQNLQNGETTFSIFIDLTKAFDSINHSILLSKLNKYGIRGVTAKLIKNYLTGRIQRTKVNGVFSQPEYVTCGIPQGSILGPLLFNLFINDLPEASLFSVRLFADDACLTLSSRDPNNLETSVNNELVKISNWLKINKILINYKKTNYIIFSKANLKKSFNITIDGNQITRVNEAKYLGVYIDQKINWHRHIQQIKSKLSSASYIISKVRHYLNLNTLKLIYYSLVHPHLQYCVTSWGGASTTALQPIIKLQKRIIRNITKSPYNTHTKPLFVKFNILPFNILYELNVSILVHKIHHNNYTGSYNLTPLNKFHKHNTRLSKQNNFYQNFTRTKLAQSTFSSKGIKIWKKVPDELKNLPQHLFKTKLKQYLFNILKEEIT